MRDEIRLGYNQLAKLEINMVMVRSQGEGPLQLRTSAAGRAGGLLSMDGSIC